MVRETRYLWVGNLPEKAAEEQIRENFQRYGKVQSVKLVPKKDSHESVAAAVVAFMDIKSAAKAHNSENTIDGATLETGYSDPGGKRIKVTRPPGSAGETKGPPVGSEGPVGKTNQQQGRKFGSQRNNEGFYSADRNAYTRPNTQFPSSKTPEELRGQPPSAPTQGGEGFPDRGRSRQRYQQWNTSHQGGKGYKYEGSSQEQNEQSHPNDKGGRYPRGGTSPSRTSAGQLPQRYQGKRSGKGSRSGSRSQSRSSSRSSSSGSISSRSSRSVSKSSKKRIQSQLQQPSSSSSSSQHQPTKVEAGDKHLGILIKGFPGRSTDTSLRDGLYHEYKKMGKVTSVSIHGEGDARQAVVSFKKHDDAAKAYEVSIGKRFFGNKIEVERHAGYEAEDSEFRPPEAELDEFHHKATRTLFIGNLEKDIEGEELRKKFAKFGYILDVDIKKQGNVTAYAFVQFNDITSVVAALHEMDGEQIGGNKIKLGFGKSMPTNCVWLDGITDNVDERLLARTFQRHGPISYVVIDRDKGRALLYFDSPDLAQRTVNDMRGRVIGGKKIQIDFASRDCQSAFYDNMEETGQMRPSDRPEDRMGSGQTQAAGTYAQTPTGQTSYGEERYSRASFGARGSRYSYESGTSRSRGRGRGNFRGEQRERVAGQARSQYQRGHSTGSGGNNSRQAYYENYPEAYRERRGSRHYDSSYSQEEDGYEDSYEKELLEFGYSQRERREQRQDSRGESPFSRGSRHQSPTRERYTDRYGYERFKDTDSQSGDRESIRSYRSDTRREFSERVAYDERYMERFSESGRNSRDRRAHSPDMSEYSYRSHSPGQYRSRSTSPPPYVMEKHDKGKEAYSPSTPTQDDFPTCASSRHTSPVEYPYGTKSREYRARYEKLDYPDSAEGYSERTARARAGELKYPQTSRDRDSSSETKSSKERDRRASRDELPQRSLKSEIVQNPPRKKSFEESLQDKLRICKEASDQGWTDRLERQSLSRTSVTGSSWGAAKTRDSMDYSQYDSSERPSKIQVISSSAHSSRSRYDYERDMEKLEGEFSSPSSKDDSDQDSFEKCSSGTASQSTCSSEVVQLESEKTRILKLMNQLDDTPGSSDTDGELSSEEKRRNYKNQKLQEVFDMDRSPTLSMRKWRDSVKAMDVDELVEHSRSRDFYKAKHGPTTDKSLSFRKQMEQWRKQELKKSPSAMVGDLRTSLRVSVDARPSSPVRMSVDDETFDLDLEKSPVEIPTEFIPKKRRKVDPSQPAFVKPPRKYRNKRSDDSMDVSSGEEEKTRRGLSRPEKLHKMDTSMSDKFRTRTDSKIHTENSDRRMSLTERLEGVAKLAEFVSPLQKPTCRSRRDSRDSMRSGSTDLHLRSEPKIIPETVVETIGPDGKKDRRIPQDPRTLPPPGKRERPSISLPLPQFALKLRALSSSTVRDSPKPLVSPKLLPPTTVCTASQQVSPATSKSASPPFSPGPGPSPQMSPALTKSDSATSLTLKDSVMPTAAVVPRVPTTKETSALQTPSEQSASKEQQLTVGLQEQKTDTHSAPELMDKPLLDTKDTSGAGQAVPEMVTSNDVPVEKTASPAHDKPDATATTDQMTLTPVTPEQKNVSPSKLETPNTEPTFSPNTGSPRITSSDSEGLPEFGSPGHPSLEERIRLIDEKLSLCKPPVTKSLSTSSSEPSVVDYRSKYTIRKRLDSNTPSVGNATEQKSEPSDIMKSLLMRSRSSILDQDSRRLEQFNTKYEPTKEGGGGEDLGMKSFAEGSSLFRQGSAPSMGGSIFSSTLTSPYPGQTSAQPSGLGLLSGASQPNTSGFTFGVTSLSSPLGSTTSGSLPLNSGATSSFNNSSSPLLQSGLQPGLQTESGLNTAGRLQFLNRKGSSFEQGKSMFSSSSIVFGGPSASGFNAGSSSSHSFHSGPSGLPSNIGGGASQTPSQNDSSKLGGASKTEGLLSVSTLGSTDLTPSAPSPNTSMPPTLKKQDNTIDSFPSPMRKKESSFDISRLKDSPGPPILKREVREAADSSLTPGKRDPRTAQALSPNTPPAVNTNACAPAFQTLTPTLLGVKRKMSESFESESLRDTSVAGTPSARVPGLTEPIKSCLKKTPPKPDVPAPVVTDPRSANTKTDSSHVTQTQQPQTKQQVEPETKRPKLSSSSSLENKKDKKKQDGTVKAGQHKDVKKHVSSHKPSDKSNAHKKQTTSSSSSSSGSKDGTAKKTESSTATSAKDKSKDHSRGHEKHKENKSHSSSSACSTSKDKNKEHHKEDPGKHKKDDHDSKQKKESASEDKNSESSAADHKIVHGNERSKESATRPSKDSKVDKHEHKSERKDSVGSTSSNKTKSKSVDLKHKEPSKHKESSIDQSSKSKTKHEDKSKSDRQPPTAQKEKPSKQTSDPKHKEKSPKLEKSDSKQDKDSKSSHKHDKSDKSEKQKDKVRSESSDKKIEKSKSADKVSSHKSDKPSAEKSDKLKEDNKQRHAKDSKKSKDEKKSQSLDRRDSKKSDDSKRKDQDRSRQSNSASSKSSKKRSQDKTPERKREKSIDENRELKQLQQLQTEEEMLMPFMSMYDMVKWRSTKEREKEVLEKRAKESFNELKTSRRRKSNARSSDDSSDDSDEDSDLSFTSLDSPKARSRRRSGSRTPASRKTNFLASTSEEDSFGDSDDGRPKEKRKILKRQSHVLEMSSDSYGDDSDLEISAKKTENKKKQEKTKTKKTPRKNSGKNTSLDTDSENDIGKSVKKVHSEKKMDKKRPDKKHDLKVIAKAKRGSIFSSTSSSGGDSDSDSDIGRPGSKSLFSRQKETSEGKKTKEFATKSSSKPSEKNSQKAASKPKPKAKSPRKGQSIDSDDDSDKEPVKKPLYSRTPSIFESDSERSADDCPLQSQPAAPKISHSKPKEEKKKEKSKTDHKKDKTHHGPTKPSKPKEKYPKKEKPEDSSDKGKVKTKSPLETKKENGPNIVEETKRIGLFSEMEKMRKEHAERFERETETARKKDENLEKPSVKTNRDVEDKKKSHMEKEKSTDSKKPKKAKKKKSKEQEPGEKKSEVKKQKPKEEKKSIKSDNIFEMMGNEPLLMKAEQKVKPPAKSVVDKLSSETSKHEPKVSKTMEVAFKPKEEPPREKAVAPVLPSKPHEEEAKPPVEVEEVIVEAREEVVEETVIEEAVEEIKLPPTEKITEEESHIQEETVLDVASSYDAGKETNLAHGVPEVEETEVVEENIVEFPLDTEHENALMTIESNVLEDNTLESGKEHLDEETPGNVQLPEGSKTELVDAVQQQSEQEEPKADAVVSLNTENVSPVEKTADLVVKEKLPRAGEKVSEISPKVPHLIKKEKEEESDQVAKESQKGDKTKAKGKKAEKEEIKKSKDEEQAEAIQTLEQIMGRNEEPAAAPVQDEPEAQVPDVKSPVAKEPTPVETPEKSDSPDEPRFGQEETMAAVEALLATEDQEVDLPAASSTAVPEAQGNANVDAGAPEAGDQKGRDPYDFDQEASTEAALAVEGLCQPATANSESPPKPPADLPGVTKPIEHSETASEGKAVASMPLPSSVEQLKEEEEKPQTPDTEEDHSLSASVSHVLDILESEKDTESPDEMTLPKMTKPKGSPGPARGRGRKLSEDKQPELPVGAGHHKVAALVTPATYLPDVPPATAEGKSLDMKHLIGAAHKPRFSNVGADVGFVRADVPSHPKPGLPPVSQNELGPICPKTSRDSAAVPGEETKHISGQLFQTELGKEVPHAEIPGDDSDIPEEAPLVIDHDPPSHDLQSPTQDPMLSPNASDGKPKRGKTRGRKTAPDSKTDEPKFGTEAEHDSVQDASQRSPRAKSPAMVQTRSRAEDTGAMTTRRRDSGEGAEKTMFSSRGRKIIPKGRDDEVTSVLRKGRKSKEMEVEGKGRGRRASGATQGTASVGVGPELNIMTRPKRVRKTSQRGMKDEDAEALEGRSDEARADVSKEEGQKDDDGSDDTIATRGRRTPRRRAQGNTPRRSGRTEEPKEGDFDPEEKELVIALDEPLEGTRAAEEVRPKRGRKSRAVKALEMSPKGKVPDVGSTSPRSRSTESSTSPKGSDYNKPVVKLEKLSFVEGGVRKEESGQRDDKSAKKDLYEWEDEDEEPIAEYKHTRKRKATDPPGTADPVTKRPNAEGQEASDAQDAKHAKDATKEVDTTVKAEAQEKEKPVDTSLTENKAGVPIFPHAPVAVPKTEAEGIHLQNVLPKPEPVEVKPIDTKLPKRESTDMPHLPLKLEMKKEHQAMQAQAAAALMASKSPDAVRSTQELVSTGSTLSRHVITSSMPGPAITTTVNAATTTPRTWPTKIERVGDECPSAPPMAHPASTTVTTPLSIMDNMDRIIQEVASGNFIRGDEYDFYSKKKRGPVKAAEGPAAAKATSPHSVTVSAPPLVTPVSQHQRQQQAALSHAVPASLATTPAQTLPRMAHQLSQGIVTGSAMKSPPTPAVSMTATSQMNAQPLQGVPASVIQTKVPPPEPAGTVANILALHQAQLAASSQAGVSRQLQLPPSAVHIGVVSGQPYSMVHRESSPQGQVIEKVPNPHIVTSVAGHIPLALDTHHQQHGSVPPHSRMEPQRPPSQPPIQMVHPVGGAAKEGQPSAAGPPHKEGSHPGLQQQHLYEGFQTRRHPTQAGSQPAPMEGVLPRPISSTQVPATSQPNTLSPQLKEQTAGSGQPSPHVGPPPSQMQGHPGYPAHAQIPYGMMVSNNQASQHSPTPQASELRAALKQPSKLIQQEQMMHQERLLRQQQQQQHQQQHQQQQQQHHQQQQQQQQQQHSAPPAQPHPPERQSPGQSSLGQHHLPFTVQEPPRAVPTSRAEPKHETRPAQSHIPPTQFADPSHMSPGNPNSSAFAHPDGRQGLPQGLPPGVPQHMYADMRFQHPGMAYPLGHHRMMFPNQATAEFFKHNAAMMGMIPSGVIIPQPQVTPPIEHHGQDSRPSSARPPSRHPTPPSAQPSPRPTTPHSGPHQQTPTAVVQPLPSPQDRIIAGPPAIPARMEMREPSDGMGMLLQRYPMMWQGSLALKNDSTSVQMHFVRGSQQVATVSLPPMSPQGSLTPLRIAQRMRLEQVQLDQLARRMQNEADYSMLVAVPCGTSHVEILTQTQNLRSGFINYLQQKQAAGIVNVQASGSNIPACVVHVFPPCEFTQHKLQMLAPDLLHSISDMAHLLIIIATV